MKTARRITSNFISLALSELISKIIQIIIFIYLARIFGKLEFGKFGFGFAFATIIAVIADFGINTLLIREISRDKKNVGKYVSNALTIKCFLSLITFFIASIFLIIGKYSKDTVAIAYIMLVFMVLQTFTDLFYSVFRAFEKMYYDALLKVVRVVILLLLVSLSMKVDYTLTQLTVIFPLSEIIVLIMSIAIYMKNFAKISFGFDLNFDKKLMKESFFFCLSILFGNILLYIDTVILENIKPNEVGLYAAAYNLLLGMTFIPLMFSNAVYPVFSRYFINNKELLKFAYKKSYQYMLMLGLPITLGIFIYARNIVLLAYGVEYSRSIIAVKILCWFILLRFVNITSGTLLSSINKQRARVIGQGIVATVNLVLNLMLIPKYGFIGAAIATIASESLFLVTYNYFIYKERLNFKLKEIFIKPLIASVIMTIVILLIPNLLAGFFLGALSYFGVMLILRAFKQEDKQLIIKVLSNR